MEHCVVEAKAKQKGDNSWQRVLKVFKRWLQGGSVAWKSQIAVYQDPQPLHIHFREANVVGVGKSLSEHLLST